MITINNIPISIDEIINNGGVPIPIEYNGLTCEQYMGKDPLTQATESVFASRKVLLELAKAYKSIESYSFNVGTLLDKSSSIQVSITEKLKEILILESRIKEFETLFKESEIKIVHLETALQHQKQLLTDIQRQFEVALKNHDDTRSDLDVHKNELSKIKAKNQENKRTIDTQDEKIRTLREAIEKQQLKNSQMKQAYANEKIKLSSKHSIKLNQLSHRLEISKNKQINDNYSTISSQQSHDDSDDE